MLLPGIEDPKLTTWRQWELAECFGRAVDVDKVVGSTESGHTLIENPTRHPDELILGLAAEGCDPLSVQLNSIESQDSLRGGQFEGRAAAHSRPDDTSSVVVGVVPDELNSSRSVGFNFGLMSEGLTE